MSDIRAVGGFWQLFGGGGQHAPESCLGVNSVKVFWRKKTVYTAYTQPTELGRSITRFFQEYLPTLRGMSRHTIQSYRDGMILFLEFSGNDCGRSVEALELADISADRVGRFLTFLEVERENGIATRNVRLAAMHTFARFLIAENPEHMLALQQVLGIPFKRGARATPFEYLETAEVEVLLASIDRQTSSGQRDYAMFSLMFNTGARVQEILNLRMLWR